MHKTLWASMTLTVFGLALAAAQDTHPAPHPLLLTDLNSEVDKRLAAAGDPAKALPMFSAADDVKFVYVRNPACWAHDLDLTGVVVSHDYISQGNYVTSSGALITPQDVVCAAHFPHPVGAVLNFVDAHNVVRTGKITAVAVVPGTDICLCHLAAPVSGVKSYRVLPENYTAYAANGDLTHWPILLAFNFGHVANLLDGDRLAAEFMFHPCREPARAPYTIKISSGSGSPAFAVINGEPILIGCLHTTVSVSWVAGHEAAINALLASFPSNYRLKPVDLAKPVAYMLF